MPMLTDDDDRHMQGRLVRAFKHPDNKEWARAYFDKGTHAGHSDVHERARHQRHIEAVQHMAEELAEAEAAKQYQASLGYQSVDTKSQIEAQISKARSEPAYLDGAHKDHQDAVSRVSWLYRQLNPE